ncbi:switch-associated protein 70 isoform X2 [Neoarius graeffei]|uniref:switch-associated protein 70 isoform X2 n=1 Tax=Neoarius graeffei TaxID=443677 RepID=UPI00298C3C4B|nr:switch-associated protein 70 isoform X2 [Neoarius graeffei]
MVHRSEILKPVWHAFAALDVGRKGKVSKSQLKVLSHNLYTVLKIPHQNSELEEHFKDDDEGPVSTQGYMPYLNTFILDRIQGKFDFQELNKMCWTLCAHKNITNNRMLISEDDAFKVWCIFNFLCEERYPLVIVMEEIEYFLRKLLDAMSGSWNEGKFVDYKAQLSLKQNCLSVWELIELVGMGYFTKGMDRHTTSMGITEVYQELILNILKQGYMIKKGHKRKNWTERWFELRLDSISYYVSEDLTEKKGSVSLDRHCCVEPLPDKEGKRNLFIIRCTDKSFEISASDKKKRQEWIQAIQDCINRLRQGLSTPHREARQRRRELRSRLQADQALMEGQMKELQLANERKQRELEAMRKNLEEAAARALMEEQRRIRTQGELQNHYRMDLEKEKMVRQQMEEQVDQMSSELKLYLQRVQELEDMYRRLEEALEDERQMRQAEENLRKLQARLLDEEVRKRTELEQIHLQQQQAISQTQQEKEQLEQQRLEQECTLQAAMQQLESLEQQRQGALEEYEAVKKKLEQATNKTKSWKDKVAQHEGLIRLIQPGSKGPQKMTNWGAAAFTDTELEMREKIWLEKKNKPDSAL